MIGVYIFWAVIVLAGAYAIVGFVLDERRKNKYRPEVSVNQIWRGRSDDTRYRVQRQIYSHVDDRPVGWQLIDDYGVRRIAPLNLTYHYYCLKEDNDA